MTGNLPEPVAHGALTGPGHFVRRTAELACQDQPVIVWQRTLAPGIVPRLRIDGVLEAGDQLIDVPTGRALPGTPGRSPLAALITQCYHRMYRMYDGLLVAARRAEGGMVCVEAADPRSGEVAWRRGPVPESEFAEGAWGSWLRGVHQDPDVLIPRGRSGGQMLELSDPSTGRPVWAVPWPADTRRAGADPPEYGYDLLGEFRHLRGSKDRATPRGARPGGARDGPRARLAVVHDLLHPAGGLAGVDAMDGTLLWRIRYPRLGTDLGWKEPVYLGAADRHLVLAGVAEGPPEYDGPARRGAFPREISFPPGACSCRGPGAPGPDEPNICSGCGGVFHPWMMVAVHDRASGRRVWGHRWPDRTFPDTGIGDVDIRDGALLTREGAFLRGRCIQDGSLLWSAIPPPRNRFFAEPGKHPSSQWAWLCFHAPGPGTDRGRAEELFVHALTGRTVAVRGAFHQTGDDLVLTRVGDTLTCLALPGRPSGTSSSAVRGRVAALDWDIGVDQNGHLPPGRSELQAVVTVTAAGHPSSAAPARLAEVFLLDTSASIDAAWLAAEQQAVAAAVDRLRDGCWFAIVAGAETASMVYPPREGLAVADAHTRAEAKQALAGLTAGGGIAIGRWLLQAQRLLGPYPEAIRHVLLLLAGQADHESELERASSARQCSGVFTCDGLGLGTDWRIADLRGVYAAILGRIDIVRAPRELTAAVTAAAENAMASAAADVYLRIRPATGVRVRFARQVAPAVADLAQHRTQTGPGAVDYLTGSWGAESRDYHLCLEVPPGNPGDLIRACQVSVVTPGAGGTVHESASKPVLAEWTTAT